MTDNEIIMALELCATLDSSNCKKCPCQEICNECDGTYNKAVLDLINRQKAEIERLKNENFGLGTERDAAMECMDTAVIEAKSEAYKEFAGKHREMIMAFREDDDQISLKVCEYDANTDNLLKEMVGDE